MKIQTVNLLLICLVVWFPQGTRGWSDLDLFDDADEDLNERDFGNFLDHGGRHSRGFGYRSRNVHHIARPKEEKLNRVGRDRILNKLLEELELIETRGHHNMEKPKKRNLHKKYDFEDEKDFPHCFEFKYLLGRKLTEFPNVDFAPPTKPFDLHIPGLVNRALTMLKVFRSPSSIAKELVLMLTNRMLSDLTKCPATKVHQGLVYGMSQALVHYRSQNQNEIAQFRGQLLAISPYIKIEPMIHEVMDELVEGFLEILQDASYEDLESNLEKLEENLEEGIETALENDEEIEPSFVEDMITNATGGTTVSCQRQPSIASLLAEINATLSQLSNGFPMSEIKPDLEEHMSKYFNDSQIDEVAKIVQDVGKGIVGQILVFFKAFVSGNGQFFIQNKLIVSAQLPDLNKIFQFVHQALNSTPTRRHIRSAKSDVLENLLVNLLKRVESNVNVSGSVAVSGPTGPTSSPTSIITAPTGSTGPSSTSSSGVSGPSSFTGATGSSFTGATGVSGPPSPTSLPPLGPNGTAPKFFLPDPCFNFDVALSRVLGGFPQPLNALPAENVTIASDDLSGLIEKSMTVFRLFGDPDLAANELVFSISELALQKQNTCPSTRLVRAVFFALARALDLYEDKMADQLGNLEEKLEKESHFDKLAEVIEDANRFSLASVLTRIRKTEFAVTKRRMTAVLRRLSKVIRRPNVSNRKLERTLRIDNSKKWSWNCNDHVSVRRLFRRIKKTTNLLFRNQRYIVHRHLRQFNLTRSLYKEVAKMVLGTTRGFLGQINQLFKALLLRDEQYLVTEHQIFSADQFLTFENLFSEVGGALLPSFISPVTEVELNLLVAVQLDILNGKTGNIVKELSKRCKELQHVHIPKAGQEVVNSFFDNCKKMLESNNAVRGLAM